MSGSVMDFPNNLINLINSTIKEQEHERSYHGDLFVIFMSKCFLY